MTKIDELRGKIKKEHHSYVWGGEWGYAYILIVTSCKRNSLIQQTVELIQTAQRLKIL